MPTISLRVNGRNYRFDCAEGEQEHLSGLAAHLDGHLKSLAAAHGIVGDERLLMMAALTVTDELMEARARIAELESSGPTRRSKRKAETASKTDQLASLSASAGDEVAETVAPETAVTVGPAGRDRAAGE